MKTRAMADVCLKGKSVIICDGKGCQWIGDGSAFFAVYGLPHLTPEGFCGVFDIPEDCSSMVRAKDAIPLFDEFYEGEIAVERDALAAKYCPDGLEVFSTSKGLTFIRDKYLKPFDRKSQNLFFFERGNVIAVKEGITLRAVIAPCLLLNDQYIDGLADFLEKCRATALNTSKDTTEDAFCEVK